MPKKKRITSIAPTLGAENILIIGKLDRFQTRKTALLSSIARRFPGQTAETVKQIADYVFHKTPIEESATVSGGKLSRHAEKVLSRGAVDLLHCYDRSHALIGILNAKKIPSWLVMEVDWRNFAHTYVEVLIGKKIYTIGFRSYERPIVNEGKVETAMDCVPGSYFLRGNDLGNLGVTDREGLKHLIAQVNAGKEKGTIK